jgi:hypothetical protein
MSKHAQRITVEEVLPPHIVEVLKELPRYVNRRTGAELVTKHLFPVSHRSLETWPISTRLVNNQAIMETEELFKRAWTMFAAAPLIKGGRVGHEAA